MTSSYTFNTKRPMWSVAQGAPGRDHAMFEDAASWDKDDLALIERTNEYLVLGEKQVAIASIKSYCVEIVQERDMDGLLAAAGVLMNLAMIFLIGVMAFGWRQNFLIAVVLMMALGVASLLELFNAGVSRYQKLTIYHDQGAPITFTCADPGHIEELKAFLEDREIQQI